MPHRGRAQQDHPQYGERRAECVKGNRSLSWTNKPRWGWRTAGVPTAAMAWVSRDLRQDPEVDKTWVQLQLCRFKDRWP